MRVVQFELGSIVEISAVRLLLPKDLRALERRRAVAEAMKETFQRFEAEPFRSFAFYGRHCLFRARINSFSCLPGMFAYASRRFRLNCLHLLYRISCWEYVFRLSVSSGTFAHDLKSVETFFIAAFLRL